MTMWQRLGLVVVFFWFLTGGLGHFLYQDFFVRIVPTNVKGPETVVLVTGVLELLGAIALLMPTLRRLAGWCLFVLALVLTAANLQMWVNFDQYPEFAPALLGFRLVLQIFLLALILFSTQPLRHSESA
jgi:uncharacterized membrane protein